MLKLYYWKYSGFYCRLMNLNDSIVPEIQGLEGNLLMF